MESRGEEEQRNRKGKKKKNWKVETKKFYEYLGW